MPTKRQLVLEHLERVSWRVMDAYPEVVRAMIRRRSGVYALYKRNQLYYVGLASNLMVRLKQHLKDRHRGAWDRFSVYLTVRDDHMKELESLILRITEPAGNKMAGRFAASRDLRTTLGRSMRQADADRRAVLLGGKAIRRRRKAKAKRKRGGQPLKGLIDRPIKLRAEADGYEYSATLRKDGTIRYGQRIFSTPSAAGKAARGKGCRGWSFWRYRNDAGEWVPLRALRS